MPEFYLGSLASIKIYIMHYQCQAYNKVYSSMPLFINYARVTTALNVINAIIYISKFISGFWDETFVDEVSSFHFCSYSLHEGLVKT